MTARIKEIDDPRLTTGASRRMRGSLPTALLFINASLALNAAQRQDYDTAGYHGKVIRSSGWDAEKALRMAVTPLRDRLEILCQTVKSEAENDAVHADQAANRLLVQTQPILAAMDSILSNENAVRIHAHDKVALCLRSCQVSFGNKTEDWQRSETLVNKALAIAASGTVRMRLENDLKIVRENLGAGPLWCVEGYFDLPEPVLKLAEKAREKADIDDYDAAVDLLKKILLNTAKHHLTEKEVKLVRKLLAHTLNMRWMRKHSAALEEFNALSSFIYNLMKRVIDHPSSFFSESTCISCGNSIYGRYAKLTFKDIQLHVCMACNSLHEEEENRKKSALRHSIKINAEGLLLADKLDPDNEDIKSSLDILKKQVSKFGAALPDDLTIFVESGLANVTELIDIATNASLNISITAFKRLKKLDPKAAAKVEGQIRRREIIELKNTALSSNTALKRLKILDPEAAAKIEDEIRLKKIQRLKKLAMNSSFSISMDICKKLKTLDPEAAAKIENQRLREIEYLKESASTSNTPLYQPSKYLSVFGLLRIICMTIFCIACTYILGAIYSKFVYTASPIIRPFISLGYGSLTGLSIGYSFKLGRVRGIGLLWSFTLIFSLCAVYIGWFFWIFFLVHYKISSIFLHPELFLRPDQFLSILQGIAEIGTWSVFDWKPTGIFLYLIWSIEAIVIVVMSLVWIDEVMGDCDSQDSPLCGHCNKFIKEKNTINTIEYVGDPNVLRVQLEQGNYLNLMILRKTNDKSNPHTQIDLHHCSHCQKINLLSVKSIKKEKDKLKEYAVVKKLMITAKVYNKLKKNW